jgi:hypothetical protein
VIEPFLLGVSSTSLLLASTEPHRRNLVFAIAAVVFIFMAAGLLLIEVLVWWSAITAKGRRAAGESPRSGYLGHVSAVLAGPAPKVLRKRAFVVMAVSGVVAVVAFII